MLLWCQFSSPFQVVVRILYLESRDLSFLLNRGGNAQNTRQTEFEEVNDGCYVVFCDITSKWKRDCDGKIRFNQQPKKNTHNHKRHKAQMTYSLRIDRLRSQTQFSSAVVGRERSREG